MLFLGEPLFLTAFPNFKHYSPHTENPQFFVTVGNVQ
jgi:hypothetical protein